MDAAGRRIVAARGIGTGQMPSDRATATVAALWLAHLAASFPSGCFLVSHGKGGEHGIAGVTAPVNPLVGVVKFTRMPQAPQ